jgi:hypothetical protein
MAGARGRTRSGAPCGLRLSFLFPERKFAVTVLVAVLLRKAFECDKLVLEHPIRGWPFVVGR